LVPFFAVLLCDFDTVMSPNFAAFFEHYNFFLIFLKSKHCKQSSFPYVTINGLPVGWLKI
jgi:hypothetical protein